MRVTSPSRFFVIDADEFGRFDARVVPDGGAPAGGPVLRQRRACSEIIGQRERLLALGSLSAGLTHELNNPAAAAVRATSSLRERVAGMRHKLGAIAGGTWDRETMVLLVRLQEEAVDRIGKAPELGPLQASDREDELTDWFDAHGIDGGWELSPTFAQAGVETEWLDHVAAKLDTATLAGAVRWLNYSLETELLMNEIEDATTRVSTLVGAAKQYSQLDRGPVQVVDVHELLDSTLLMLSSKIGKGVTVEKDYDRSLPRISVHGAELNQVWTNLIDNAVQAMEGEGTLTVRTAPADDRHCVDVEIGDTGPGIADDVRARIFEPFFTTKGVGQGTGLGLDISWRIVVDKHHGDLSVESRPGGHPLPRPPADHPAGLIRPAVRQVPRASSCAVRCGSSRRPRRGS